MLHFDQSVPPAEIANAASAFALGSRTLAATRSVSGKGYASGWRSVLIWKRLSDGPHFAETAGSASWARSPTASP